MRDISDEDMAEITDEIESCIADALVPLYNKLAKQYKFPETTTDALYDTGIDTGFIPDMRESAVRLFEYLGMDIQGNGLGF